jgi:transcriptional regulator with XRE-family HTH domain
MRWDYGEVYKKIRKEKSLTQKQICGDYISRTTLSKFENNQLSPSYSTMDFLLKQIDMSHEEFLFVCNNFDYDKRDDIIHSFFNYFSNCNNFQLEKLITKSTAYLKSNEDVFIENILLTLKSMKLLNLGNESTIDCLPKLFISKVWDRISKMDQWYYNEIRLLNCFLFYFPIDVVENIYPRLLTSLEKYEHFKPIATIKLSVLLNTALLLLQNGLLSEAKLLGERALEIANDEKRLDYMAVAMVRYGICVKEKKTIDKGFYLLKYINVEKLESKLLCEVSTYYKEEN